MLSEKLCDVVVDMCKRAGVPISVAQMHGLLDSFVEMELIEAACVELTLDGVLTCFKKDYYFFTKWKAWVFCNMLVSKEYQRLGMSVLHLGALKYVRHIPAEAEHRFLEVRPSSIGEHAGMGLFVRPSRTIPQGCILCEYTGRRLQRPPSDSRKGTYVVHVKSTSEYIDGVNEDGDNLSLASFINDDGPGRMNAGMVEFSSHPGRVFVVAHRDILADEEVFVLYGATYWGVESYDRLPSVFKPKRRTRGMDDDCFLAINFLRRCRRCEKDYLFRTALMHEKTCQDGLAEAKVTNLSCTPKSHCTAISTNERLLPRVRQRALRVALSLVDLSDPQTFSHSCEDLVRDLEFSFQDVEEGK